MLVNDALKYKAKIALMRNSFWDYCKIKAPDFYTNDRIYLKEICDAMQRFIKSDAGVLIVNSPPRHGKTYTQSMFIEWFLGNDTRRKVISVSYQQILSKSISRRIKNSINMPKIPNEIVFSDVFPYAKIGKGTNAVDFWGFADSPVENYLATTPGSAITGLGATCLVVDDLIKNKYEAYNQFALEKQWEWFTDTAFSRKERLKGQSPKVIVVMTRWSKNDIAGRLIDDCTAKNKPFVLITHKAYDEKISKMLNPDILTYEDYQEILMTVSNEIVEANYNQEPIELKGNLYSNFKEWAELPKDIKRIFAVCDTADTGKDYLCNIICAENRHKEAYVLDVYYTQEPMEVTEPETAKRLIRYEVKDFYPESNSGGRGFARSVNDICRKNKHYFREFKPYTQTTNKLARILSQATDVLSRVIMPKDWRNLYPEFNNHIRNFQRGGKNMFDDAPDTLTAIIEIMDNTKLPVAASGLRLY